MDSFEWNKIFMGLGFSALALLGIREVTGAVYHVDKPEQTGYVVAGVEETAVTPGDAAAATMQMPDFGTVLASADIAAGEAVFAKCTQCHTADKGGPNKIGPNLYNVVGGKHAHLGDSFAYSAAMKALSGETWDYEHLYAFLESPGKVIKGTKMAFAGLKKSDDRINVIAFLRSKSDSPLALPAPAPAGAAPAPAGEEGTPAPAENGEAAPAAPAAGEGANPATGGAGPEGDTGAPATGETQPPAPPPAEEGEAQPAPSPEPPAAARPPEPERVDGTTPTTEGTSGAGTSQPETPPAGQPSSH
jgi:cytochrome c